ncbi:hypothetical protein MNBD_GAMMA09-527 [hydrothermal vent metagenome]|uniref:Histidine kinase domain-containing protein n=1 Tax=hydrothermal vent metagenome TaxID=652676 RepID=A0A3B0X4R9_9ZZZZ
MPTHSFSKKIDTLTKFEFLNLGLMLLLLHLALHQQDENNFLVSSLLLAHFGFFLLWQPVINTAESISIKTLLIALIVNSLLYFFLNDWFIGLWIIFLIGLTSGSALVSGIQRSLYALAAVILFLQLSLTLTPKLFNLEVLDENIEQVVFYAIIIACSVIIFWPYKKYRTVKTDYLHGLIISFGLFSFYITSILISYTANIHYLQSLLITALSIGSGFVFLSIIWLPRHGISGIGQLWEQHILNIGNPFETWVKQTSLLDQNKKITADLFLKNSIEHLLTLSWVSGVNWSDEKKHTLYGQETKYSTTFTSNNINVQIYSHIPMGAALKIHAQLLMHLMNYFYTSKLREITLMNQTHLKAVYETGSKLTHDMKNILQSLHTLTSVVQTTDDPQKSHQLMKKQLPLLSQRLQNTLDKLQTKTDTGCSFSLIQTWWKELQSRYHGRDILFEGEIYQNTLIDIDVFDTVLENFLENARSKRRSNPDISIIASIYAENERIVIQVCDTGEPVPTSKKNEMFKQILPSNDGYGIGLYQSAQLAEKNGFKLNLLNNESGNICFQLSNSDL